MTANPPKWYYTDGVTSYGPIDQSTLEQLIRAGLILPNHSVRKEGDANWEPAAHLLPRHFGPGGERQLGAHSKTSTGSLKWTRFATLVPPTLFVLFGILTWRYLCRLRFPTGEPYFRSLSEELPAFLHSFDPTRPFNLGWELFVNAFVFIPLVFLGWSFGKLARIRHRARLNGRKPPSWWKPLRVIVGVALLVFSFAVAIFSRTAQSTALLATLYYKGVASPHAVQQMVLGLAICALIVAAIAWRSWVKVRQFRKDGETEPAEAASCLGTAMTSILLLVASSVQGAFCSIAFAPPQNPDERAVKALASAVRRFSDAKGDALQSIILNASDQPEAGAYLKRLPTGDVVAQAGNDFLRLLEIDMKSDSGYSSIAAITSTWTGLPLAVGFDANSDGVVEIQGCRFSGRAIVWSPGWNGLFEGGRGDDVTVCIE